VLRVVDGRFLSTDLRGVAGTVSLVGAITTDERCGQEGTAKIADCAPSKRSFAGARIRVTSPRAGVLEPGPVRRLRLARALCPREPAKVERAPLGPIPTQLRVSPRTLEDPNVRRITLRASARRTTTYASPEAGTLKETVRWTLTLVRPAR
jgi:hypothetical protein